MRGREEKGSILLYYPGRCYTLLGYAQPRLETSGQYMEWLIIQLELPQQMASEVSSKNKNQDGMK